MPAEIHKGSIGVAFRATILDQNDAVVDISAATVKEMIFKKPNGEVVTQDALFVTDGTDGRMQYVSASGDLDVVGLWRHQAHIIQSGTEFWTDYGSFKVHRNLTDSTC